jgi:hypothetical protein
MKIFTFSYKLSVFLTIVLSIPVLAQDSSVVVRRIPVDSSRQKLNMDAIYARPFLTVNKLPIAIGGYLEANTQFASTDGVTDGFSFQMRRMTLFFSSTIAKKIKFMSELEFEDGTKEINIETALMDVEFHPLLNLRGGIIMNPIGGFNQNHDGPRWDFVDRPIAATSIIPSTLSNVGFGIHGKYFMHEWILGYETYLTNGFDDKIIANELNRTALQEGKENAEKFEESNSGLPMFTGKVAIRNRKIGELGISYMSGVYNKWKEDGLIVEDKRSANVFAVDFNTSFLKNRINIIGEFAKVFVDVPDDYVQTYGKHQIGTFLDIIGTIYQHEILGWENAKLNVGVRLEYADYNQDRFRLTSEKIFDDTWAIVPSIALRPTGTTVLRLNYKYQSLRDIVGNKPSKTGIIQFGISSYF